jgi:hypothetical protein
VPVAVGVADGFCKVDIKPDGPLHDHEVAPVELAERLTIPPTQIGPLLDGAAVGTLFTVTVVVYTVAGEQPEAAPLLTVNE